MTRLLTNKNKIYKPLALVFSSVLLVMIVVAYLSNSLLQKNNLLACFVVGLSLANVILQLLSYKKFRSNSVDEQNTFQIIFEKANIGILHIESQTGKILNCNSKMAAMLGYGVDELKNKNLREIVDNYAEISNSKTLNDFRKGKIAEFNIEEKYIKKDGSLVNAKITASSTLKDGGIPTSHITLVENVTEKNLAEKKLVATENRFKSLFEDTPIPLWEEDFSELKTYLESHDLIGKPEEFVLEYFSKNPSFFQECLSKVKVINVNNECLKLHFPKTKNDLLKNLQRVMNDEAMDSFKAQILAVTQFKKNISIDSRLKKDSGEFREINLIWNVMPGYEDSLERVIVSTEDITERKEAENQIIKSKLKTESLINSIDGIVWESDLNTFRMTFINKKVEEITGYSVEEWMSNQGFWESALHPDDAEYAINFCESRAKTHNQFDFEYRMIAKNGETIWIRDIVNVVYFEGKPTSLQGIMIDITKSKDAEKALNDTFKLVSEQNKRLLNFSYIVSHNLRSHTSNIQSIATLIETAESEEERQEMIKMLQNVSTRLNETMLNLNDIVNIQGNVNLNLEDLNLNQNIQKTLEILSEQIISKNATFKIDVPKEVSVTYNPAYLESVLLNFISNAIRYSHPERKPEISLRCYTKDGQTVLEIEDNGIGLDLEKYGSKLFGMYKTFHKNADAMGLGLFITKNQIDAMGGQILVESTPNIGTKFIIYFR